MNDRRYDDRYGDPRRDDWRRDDRDRRHPDDWRDDWDRRPYPDHRRDDRGRGDRGYDDPRRERIRDDRRSARDDSPRAHRNKHRDDSRSERKERSRRSPSPPRRSRVAMLQSAEALIEEVDRQLATKSGADAGPAAPAPEQTQPPAAVPGFEPPAAAVEAPRLVPPEAAPEPPATRVYVGNINYSVAEPEVKRELERFGTVRLVSMAYDPERRHHRGYAFVEFEDAASAQAAYAAAEGAIAFKGMVARVDKPTSSNGRMNLPTRTVEQQQHQQLSLAQQMAASRGLLNNAAASRGVIPQMPGTSSAHAESRPAAIALQHMVKSQAEVDDRLLEEVRSECERYGVVNHVHFYMVNDEAGKSRINIAVEFARQEQATACMQALNGRLFAGRTVTCGMLDWDFYQRVRG